MSEQVRSGLDGPALATAEPADLAEQSLDLVAQDDVETAVEIAWDADDADALEQSRVVDTDDEHDHDT